MEKIIKKIKNAKTLQEFETASDELAIFAKTATPEQKKILGEVVEKKGEEIMKEASATKKKAEALLTALEENVIIEINGIRYNLDEWLTIPEYVQRFSINSKEVVSNWIIRGIIPPENILKINKLNKKLIKAIPYK